MHNRWRGHLEWKKFSSSCANNQRVILVKLNFPSEAALSLLDWPVSLPRVRRRVSLEGLWLDTNWIQTGRAGYIFASPLLFFGVSQIKCKCPSSVSRVLAKGELPTWESFLPGNLPVRSPPPPTEATTHPGFWLHGNWSFISCIIVACPFL